MRQCNRCLNILQKTKKENFYNLNIKQVSDNKLFWKNIKPFYSGKEPTSSKSTLVEGNGITSNEEKIANIVDDYFINITRTLNLKKHFNASNGDPSEFSSHISIEMIHER